MLQTATGSIKFKTKYQRKSGDPNTSLGNSLINAATFHHIFKTPKAPFSELGASHALILGDDNIFCTLKVPNVTKIQEEYAKYGLKVKVKVSNSIYETKFLQCMPVPATVDGIDQTVLLRNPGRAVLQLQCCPAWC